MILWTLYIWLRSSMQFTGVALKSEMPLPKQIRLLRKFSFNPFYKIYIASLRYRFFKVIAWFLRRKLTHVPMLFHVLMTWSRATAEFETSYPPELFSILHTTYHRANPISACGLLLFTILGSFDHSFYV